ncbi:MAG: hypothetical protein HYX69_09825 [Planctomycetia bacterium]|nr:hypothetical protein [Planctomycetia bacterium]
MPKKRATRTPAGPKVSHRRVPLRPAPADEAIVAGVRISHPDRVIYPDTGLTKLGLAQFYEKIADWVLPHVINRPLSLLRAPAGYGKETFFQKNLGPGMPAALHRVPIKEKGKTNEYAIIKDVAGLVALVQMGVIEIHPWGAAADDVERPDRLIFDLDPDPAAPWKEVIKAAREIHDLLAEVGLTTFLKTTGGKGLHVVAPLARRASWGDLKQFARGVAELLVQRRPALYTANPMKAARAGKIYIDYLRNDRGSTAVAAYSTRARPRATVSVPLTWRELSASLSGDHFTVANLPARLARVRDPWKDFFTVKQSIGASKELRFRP